MHRLTTSAFAIALALLVGCSTTADIYLKHHDSVTGYIASADPERVYVRKEVRDGSMTYISPYETSIPRQQIVSVDHPGNVLLVFGILSSALGIAIINANSKSCGVTTMEMPCQLSHVPIIAGIPMAIWGLSVWLRSLTSYVGSPQGSPRMH